MIDMMIVRDTMISFSLKILCHLFAFAHNSLSLCLRSGHARSQPVAATLARGTARRETRFLKSIGD